MATATQTFHVDTGGGQTVDVTVTSSLPIRPGSAISPNLIARLIKGCRGDVTAGCFI
jgi:hypothetical protein